MLQNVADIVARVGVLLDDPSNSTFTTAYLLPFIDQEYELLDDELERAGMQNVEGIAVFDVNAGVTDLTPFAGSQAGVPGPLASMKLPKVVQWKLYGTPDVEYQTSDFVERLDDYPVSSIGAVQWRFADDNIAITPSAQQITLRVYFDALSTNILDPSQNVIRGTAHILAARVATVVATVRGNDKLAESLGKMAYGLWSTFSTVINMADQKKMRRAQSLHRRGSYGSRFISTSNGMYQ